MNLYRRHLIAVAGLVLGSARASVAGAADAWSTVDFFRAVATDNVSGARRELERGMSPNTLNEQGQCALFVAIRDDSPRVQELLLHWPGIDLNLRNKAGETPLMIAALRGQTGIMKSLLALGVPAHQEGWSPIHYAATGPKVEAVALLLERGAPVEARAPNGSTPLMMAARYGAEASVDLLLGRGASLQSRNEQQMAPLDFARGADRDWMVRKLEKLGARPGGH